MPGADTAVPGADIVAPEPTVLSTSVPDLPVFLPLSAPTFTWGSLSGQDFTQAISVAYAEAVRWRRNIFSLPSGKAGKDFIWELSRLIRVYADRSSLEGCALQVVTVMPHLLLQKPHSRSKSSDHCTCLCLERRLTAWKQGDIDG